LEVSSFQIIVLVVFHLAKSSKIPGHLLHFRVKWVTFCILNSSCNSITQQYENENFGIGKYIRESFQLFVT
jgi:hypothetical protein